MQHGGFEYVTQWLGTTGYVIDERFHSRHSNRFEQSWGHASVSASFNLASKCFQLRAISRSIIYSWMIKRELEVKKNPTAKYCLRTLRKRKDFECKGCDTDPDHPLSPTRDLRPDPVDPSLSVWLTHWLGISYLFALTSTDHFGPSYKDNLTQRPT